MAKALYRTVLRPADSATLPAGLAWWWVEVPSYLADRRPDLPVSAFRYGVFATDVAIDAANLRQFDIEQVQA